MYFLSAPLMRLDTDIVATFFALLMVIGLLIIIYNFIRRAILMRRGKRLEEDLQVMDWATNNFAYVSRKFTERGMRAGDISRMTTDEYVELLTNIKEEKAHD